jgi:uncharacterized protein YcfJ
MQVTKLIFIVTALASLSLFTGCENNKTARNTGIGAAAGAIVGGVVGHQSGHAGEGAAIGAAAGGAGGYGYSKMKEDE